MHALSSSRGIATPHRHHALTSWWMGLLTITLLWDVSGLDMAVMQLLGNADGFAVERE